MKWGAAGYARRGASANEGSGPNVKSGVRFGRVGNFCVFAQALPIVGFSDSLKPLRIFPEAGTRFAFK